MRHILRRREFIEDDWRYLGEDGADASSQRPLIIPFPEFRTNTARWRAYQGHLGVRLAPADAIEDLAQDVQRLSLVAAEFPSAGALGNVRTRCVSGLTLDAWSAGNRTTETSCARAIAAQRSSPAARERYPAPTGILNFRLRS